jgi:hypothetical protein
MSIFVTLSRKWIEIKASILQLYWDVKNNLETHIVKEFEFEVKALLSFAI